MYKRQVDGKEVPSVTEVLKFVDKSGPISGWAKKQVKEHILAEVPYGGAITADGVERGYKQANRMATVARDKGTRTHALIEAALMLGEVPEDEDPSLVHAANEALRVVSAEGVDVVGVEYAVGSGRIAGTIDCIIQRQGKLYVVGWKRAKGFYPEYAVQVKMYMALLDHAMTHAFERPNAIGGGFVVLLPQDAEGQALAKKVDHHPNDEYTQAFTKVLDAKQAWDNLFGDDR